MRGEAYVTVFFSFVLNIQSFWEKDYVSCVFYLLVEVKVIARAVRQPGVKSTTSATAGEDSFVICEGHNSVQGSTHAQTVYRDSITSLAGETHIDEERENNGDDNTDFSSMCPTGRISFKLYDWNPAEFPRRLRHQIFQWLASMPLELEGYIRPGCTILTIFIAMPKFMWVKLNEDPVVCIYDLFALPKNMLLRRDRFYINLNSMIFSVVKGLGRMTWTHARSNVALSHGQAMTPPPMRIYTCQFFGLGQETVYLTGFLC
uniref:SBP-like protein n=1 Tax=Tanacetum cinerariifolium TaxID=118510 RepID=A0A6L2JVF1_TANCI|nr:SBP-like protein [Tanacetum cinerariifolium]